MTALQKVLRETTFRDREKGKRKKDDREAGDFPWTKAIKRALADCSKIFPQEKLVVRYGGAQDKCGPEWLVDVVWLKKQESRISQLALACESELNADGNDERCYEDFEKLMFLRAPYLLFICQVRESEYKNGNDGRTDRLNAIAVHLQAHKGIMEEQTCLIVVYRYRSEVRNTGLKNMLAREFTWKGGQWVGSKFIEYTAPK